MSTVRAVLTADEKWQVPHDCRVKIEVSSVTYIILIQNAKEFIDAYVITSRHDIFRKPLTPVEDNVQVIH